MPKETKILKQLLTEDMTSEEYLLALYEGEGIQAKKFYNLLREIDYNLRAGRAQEKLIRFIQEEKAKVIEKSKKELWQKMIKECEDSKEFGQIIAKIKKDAILKTIDEMLVEERTALPTSDEEIMKTTKDYCRIFNQCCAEQRERGNKIKKGL